MFPVAAFGQITNVSAASRRVKGVLTLEVKDKTNGWIFDYAHSKKYFEEWFNEIHNATDGKSYGNVRLMHQLQTIGKLTSVQFDDECKRILCEAEISDDKVWNGILNGEYCGLSFSGVKVKPTPEVLKEWSNLPDGNLRYIGKPAEVSIVDNPNQPGANFVVVNAAGNPVIHIEKEDGSEEDKEIILNTSSYEISELAGLLGQARWITTGDEGLQEELQKALASVANVLIKMSKNFKKEIRTENAFTGENTMADETKVVNTPPPAEPIFNAAQTEVITNTVNTAVDGAFAKFKELIDGLNIPALAEKVEKIANSTPAPTTVVTKEADSSTHVEKKDETPKFVANAAQGISEEDAVALNKISKIINKK